MTAERIAMLRREIAAILLHPAAYRDLGNTAARRAIARAYRMMNIKLPLLWMDIIRTKVRWRAMPLGRSAT